MSLIQDRTGVNREKLQEMKKKKLKRRRYIYTMEYYSAIKKNTCESVLMRQMNLEPFIQSEVSQKEKHQYSILMHICGIQKDGNDNPVRKTAKETQMYKNSLLDSLGEGEGGMIWENGIETCIISCMKRTASPSSMHDTGCLGLVHWDDPEGFFTKQQEKSYRLRNIKPNFKEVILHGVCYQAVG